MNLGAVGVIVAARMGSSRLPGKAMQPLQGLPMLAFLLRRLRPLRRASVLLATTELEADDILASLAREEGVAVFRGSENDLVARYVGAASAHGLDTVVRVTGDCPFVDADLVNWGLDRAAGFDRFDLVTTKGRCPIGLDIEIYPSKSMATLQKAQPLTATHFEHLTLYFYEHQSRYRVCTIDPPDDWRVTTQQFTVDTLTDYDRARALAALFDRPNFSVAEMLAKVAA